MRFLIFTYGYAFSRKSSAGRELSNRLMVNRVETRKLGRAERPGAREERYKALLALGERYLELDMPVILDATFGHPRWREDVYALAARHAVPVIAIHCFCEDEEVLERRRRHRQGMDDPGEAGCYRDREERAYDAEPLASDSPGPHAIVHADSGTWRVRLEVRDARACEPVRATLDEVVEILQAAADKWRLEED